MNTLHLPLPLWADTLLSPPVYLQLRSIIAGGARVETGDSSCTISAPGRHTHVQHCPSADVALSRAVELWMDAVIAQFVGEAS